MAEEGRRDEVEKLLTEQKALEDRKQALIDDLLKHREAAIAAFVGLSGEFRQRETKPS